jgi:hypothetical protein
VARDFDGTTGDFLRNETAPSADMPFTICGWFNADNISVESTIAGCTDSASSGDYAVLEFLATGAIRALVVNPGVGSAAASTTANVSAGDHHGCAVFATSTDRRVYLDGGNKGTSTGSVATTGINRFFIGLQDVVGGAGQRFGLDGRIWEAAVWTASLTDAEVAILALGYSPRFVRPASLVRYWPIIGRTSPEIDLMSGSDMTVTGTAVAAHSAMIYPTQVITGFDTAAVPPAGISIPVVYHHRQRNF